MKGEPPHGIAGPVAARVGGGRWRSADEGPTFRYAHDDLVRLLGPGMLDQWQACFRRGRVRERRIQSDGRSISGRIAGTEPRPYRATVHGTVEEKMLALPARKRTPTEGVLTGPHAAACR